MNAWSWLAVWVFGMALSIALHEAGHVFAGLAHGWQYKGIFVKPKVCGIGVNLEPNGHERDLWKVAIAGPATTLYIAAVCAQLPGPTFHSLMWLNLSILAINILPLKITDGGLVIRGLRERSAA
ncbi:MAG TPA: hypothetical protein VLA89_13135 [Gemmatimonadales bacterium]|nr:hypothetical protein [Gemmatimonadales bacterium]